MLRTFKFNKKKHLIIIFSSSSFLYYFLSSFVILLISYTISEIHNKNVSNGRSLYFQFKYFSLHRNNQRTSPVRILRFLTQGWKDAEFFFIFFLIFSILNWCDAIEICFLILFESESLSIWFQKCVVFIFYFISKNFLYYILPIARWKDSTLWLAISIFTHFLLHIDGRNF